VRAGERQRAVNLCLPAALQRPDLGRHFAAILTLRERPVQKKLSPVSAIQRPSGQGKQIGIGSDSDALTIVANPKVCRTNKIANSQRRIFLTSLVLSKNVYYKLRV
jgi:hypothetical protein